MGKELRESCLVAPSGRGSVFTQFHTHKFAHLSTIGYSPGPKLVAISAVLTYDLRYFASPILQWFNTV